MGEVLLSRYVLFLGHNVKTHATTNLNAHELENYYGNRVRSRMCQRFNLVSFDGNSQTDYTRDKTLQCHATPCSGLWTREHVFAKSLATPALTTDSPGSGTDVHNLRACDGDMNTARSNRLFEDDGVGGNAHITGSGNWYPGDEWKGDVARIIMYMYLRYPSQCIADNTAVSTNSNSPDMPDVFLQWNVDDPVSQYEIQRNTVLESMQGNRNPFIDDPYIATKIWSGSAAEDTWGVLGMGDDQFKNISVYPTTVHDRLYVSNSTGSNLKIAIYNISGQQIKTDLVDNQVEVETLKNGMYVLKIANQSHVSTFKFIKY